MKTNKILPIIIFFFITLVYAFPILKNIHNWGQMDWDQFTFWNAVPRETILRYYQFPLWNPYSNGGNVMLALPHSSFLSPFFILILLFGPVIGLKIQWIISLFLGMLGMFFLSRYLKMKKISMYLPPIVFMLCSLFTLHLSEGHVEWLAIVFLPWVFLFSLRAYLTKKYFFLTVFFFSLMIFGGSVYVFSVTLIFIIIYFILISLKFLKIKYLLSILGVFLCTFLFCSIKLIPMLDFLNDNPRKIESNEKIDISLLPSILLLQEQNLLYQNTKWTDPQKKIKFKGKEFEYGWHEYGAYVGFITLFLAIIGIFVYGKKYWPLFFTGIICLWISLGGGAFYNLWSLLHKFPIYDSLHVPSRFIIGFIFCIAIFAGFGLSKIEDMCTKKYYKSLIVAIISIIFFDMFLVDYSLLKNVFIIEPHILNRYTEFKQRYRDFNLFPEKSRSSMYSSLLSNSGVINSYEVIGVKRGEVRTINDIDYRGEVYLLRGRGDIFISYFSPNKIKVNINIKEDDILVINQNYYKGWWVIKKNHLSFADSFKGLIATPVNTSDKIVIFYYFPIPFFLGLLITMITFTTGIIFYFKKCV